MKRTLQLVRPRPTTMAKKPTKQELLDHYAGYGHEPKAFYQFDVHYVGVNSRDDIMRPDEDGDWLSCGPRYELMHGCAVRVLVEPQRTPTELLRGLRKVVEWLERLEKNPREWEKSLSAFETVSAPILTPRISEEPF